MTTENSFYTAVRSSLRGSGQVMFQQSAWTGFLFLVGIFWGSYESGTPAVAYGAIIGLLASTIAGFLVKGDKTQGMDGLWGFNGILVGCAFPTFLANTWLMWLALVFCAMCTTWVRKGLNNMMAGWKINSLTFPFVLLTWIFLLSSKMSGAMPAQSLPTATIISNVDPSLPLSGLDVVVYWLKGISQVFLINSWVTGIIFLIALAVCSRWAAMWAAIGSAVALAISLLFQFNGADISNGLFGFSPVLTAIALGCTFYKPNIRSALWTIVGIIATVFVQSAMDMLLMPLGIPTLTGPFCITTWLLWLPLYDFSKGANKPTDSDFSDWVRTAEDNLHNEDKQL